MTTSGEKMQVFASRKRCSSHQWPGQIVRPRDVVRAGGPRLLAVAETHRVAVDEAHLGVGVHEVSARGAAHPG